MAGTSGTSGTAVPRWTATRWTRPLQAATAVCSAVFALGTALQGFAVVDLAMLEYSMRLAGMAPAEAAEAAPGFLGPLRAVGCVFLAGNLVGLLALTGRSWVFWTALCVNAGQAAGVVAVPPEVHRASLDLYGVPGVLPTAVTDGGALLLAAAMVAGLVAFRGPWAQRRGSGGPDQVREGRVGPGR